VPLRNECRPTIERGIRYKNDAKCHSLTVWKSSRNWTKIIHKILKSRNSVYIYFIKIIWKFRSGGMLCFKLNMPSKSWKVLKKINSTWLRPTERKNIDA